MELNKYKNLVFDLGGVIINIDLTKTVEAFTQMTGKSYDEMQKRILQLNLYYRYEVGELDDKAFRNLIRGFVGTSVVDEQIDSAWNALLLDIPVKRIELIKKLSQTHRLFLLSNTNPIHFKEVENILKRTSGDSFYHIFEKVYLSYEMCCCKPDAEIYKKVLADKNLLPEETVFIDDNLKNVLTASALGIKGVHLQDPVTILDLF